MEYGCGVGRVTIHLANEFEHITALDISQGHLELAQQRIHTLGIKNITLQRIDSLDLLACLPKYDFIFTVIVLQHNPPPIIAMLIERFFQLLKNNGVVMFQVPVQMAEYRFTMAEYLANMNNNEGKEMHMLPQNVILEIARRNNCYLLEVHNDNSTGAPDIFVSQMFVFKKEG
jgi:2-polyprenyl-3-methyl-5-hydroxy-6-metoxy-1,4-benzoquinol methylase